VASLLARAETAERAEHEDEAGVVDAEESDEVDVVVV
jgi:hypothetical protein